MVRGRNLRAACGGRADGTRRRRDGHRGPTPAGGAARLWELREGRFGYEIDLPDAEFHYTGDEGFWTSVDMEWMIYASHESSITFGGLFLANEVTSRWPECERCRHRGYDLSTYDLP